MKKYFFIVCLISFINTLESKAQFLLWLDSLYWNTDVTPHTLFVRQTLGYDDLYKDVEVYFNTTQDTMFVDRHHIECYGLAAVYKLDTLIPLNLSLQDSDYHLVYRFFWDSNTVFIGCYIDTTTVIGSYYVGHSSWPMSTFSQNWENWLSFYPNPTNDALFIKPKNNLVIKKISVMSTLGNVVLKQEKLFETIDVHSLNKGIYYLQIETDKGYINTTFLKE